MKRSTSLSRRRFLQHLAIVAGGSSIMAYKGKLDLIQAALAADKAPVGPAKSLVCIFLYGGNDASNMLIPYQQSRYDEYANARGNLAIPRNQLQPLAAAPDFAFHPNLLSTDPVTDPNSLGELFDNGKLAVIANVGNLIQPITRYEYLNELAPVPVSLFSHSHQQEIWQTNLAPVAAVANPGWGGLMADLLINANDNPEIPVTFSTNSSNLWQSGRSTQPFALDPWNGAEEFEYLKYQNWPPNEASRSTVWDNILTLSRGSALVNEMAQTFTSTRDRVAQISQALALTDPKVADPIITTPYDSDNNLAVQLRMIARMIYAREALGQRRQIFFAAMGGWDTHGDQLATHQQLYKTLKDALYSFQQTLAELETRQPGIENSVVTFTASDFGRTLSSNGDGSDHGWGSHMLVMGGVSAVNGGQIFGEFPSLALGGVDDSGSNGRLIPTTAVDQYGASLARWMGLSDNQVSDIFPNLSNFTNRYLGFLQ